MAANYFPILQAVQAKINSLNLVDWNSNPLPNAIRKLPKVDEQIDTLPLLCIVPKDEAPQRKPLCFNVASSSPYYRVSYPVEVVWIAGGDRDFTDNQSTYMQWQSAIAAAFNLPSSLSSSVPQVWDINVRLNPVINRSVVNDNYDYGGLIIEAITSENS